MNSGRVINRFRIFQDDHFDNSQWSRYRPTRERAAGRVIWVIGGETYRCFGMSIAGQLIGGARRYLGTKSKCCDRVDELINHLIGGGYPPKECRKRCLE